ncbi:MAG: hypothetical protein KIS78_06335 [Labilithrix sp.]|nr:hypothetical protein [Labilithrix sp.]MCW5832055.1 hypothetical protein [Labilithrix sp.]
MAVRRTTLLHPDPMTTHVRVSIDGSRTEAGLGAALDALVGVARGFPRALGENEDEEVPPFLVVTFHGGGRWLSERRFFERAVRFASLRPAIARYVELVNPASWRSDPFGKTGFWTSIAAPAGSLAVVPLALSDVKYVATAIQHLRGVDLDHETFHRSFVTELWRRWGPCEETRRLIAFRAVDGAGQHGDEDLRWLAARCELGPAVNADADAFARLVDAESKRERYRALYVANAGRSLFADAPGRFARWLEFFEERGLAFEASHRELVAPNLYAPKPWGEAWESAASCTERD